MKEIRIVSNDKAVFNWEILSKKINGYEFVRSEKPKVINGIEWYSAIMRRINDMSYKIWGK